MRPILGLRRNYNRLTGLELADDVGDAAAFDLCDESTETSRRRHFTSCHLQTCTPSSVYLQSYIGLHFIIILSYIRKSHLLFLFTLFSEMRSDCFYKFFFKI